MALCVNFDDYDDPKENLKTYQHKTMLKYNKEKIPRACARRIIDLDEVVETSTFVPGVAEDAPLHDLFVVRPKHSYSKVDGMSVIEYLISLGDLGNVLDFGSGFRRKYCDVLKVLEHVEWKAHRTMCTCGCGIVPYVTPFYTHKNLRTFVAINSLQNNSYSFIQRMLAQVLFYELDFVIIEPELNSDEFSASHLIFSMFAGVRTAKLENGQTAYVFQREHHFAEVAEASLSTAEICVNVCGEPVQRDSQEIKQSVLIFGLTSTKEVLVVDAGDSGPVDFIVAGHITFGERPIEAAAREWEEEMISPLPRLEYYGMLEPPASVAKAFVFVAFLDSAECSKDRGVVRHLKSNDKCRNDFYPSIRALNRYFTFASHIDLSHFVSKHYDDQAKRIVKNLYLDRHGKEQRFESLSPGDKWNEIYRRYKKDYNHYWRIEASDLRTRFNVDMRSTNQSAQIYSAVSPGNIVILNSDTNTPCPIVTLVYAGRKVGYCVYVKTSDKKRLYRVVECNSKIFQEPDVPVDFMGVKNVAVNYTFNTTIYDVELTDNECGANLLSMYLHCTYDEAVAMIRSNLGHFKISEIAGPRFGE
jgi:hypothetical protein